MTASRIPLAGVVGWPIAHSKSPLIHGHWLAQNGIAGQYVPIGIAPQKFETAIFSLPDLGFRGVNVTVPYKEQALALAAEVTDRARQIGAANTLLFREDGGYLADNTDGVGFLNNLKQYAPNWTAASGPALVLGAGGAARAVLLSLLEDGAPQIVLSNRTRSRAKELARVFGEQVSVVDWSCLNQHVKKAATIVNTTSLGMVGQPALDIDLGSADKSTLVTDIVYNPLQTNLLKQAEDLGLQSVDGLGMLLHQAVEGFEMWFGIKPVVDKTLRDLVVAAL